MSDIKLFRVGDGGVDELQGRFVAVAQSLQVLIEKHLQELLGVRFLALQYSTGKTQAGRIDTLGIDENGSPVIVEYKRAVNQNVINQGLFYLDCIGGWMIVTIVHSFMAHGRQPHLSGCCPPSLRATAVALGW